MVCAEPRCPGPAVSRGRCAGHRETTSQRGYGTAWQAAQRMARATSCERCGVTDDLTVDHITPRSMGGSDTPSNLRTLCRSCHGSIGVKWTSRRENYGRRRGSLTCPAGFQSVRDSGKAIA